MSWHPAPCITALLNEANRLAPNRDKSSDGIIGDASHASSESDHNPDSRGIVHAIDITHSVGHPNPGSTWDCEERVQQIVEAQDDRVKYLIWNHGMWRSYDKPGIPKWTRATYTGSNPHDHHMHVSVQYDARENDTSLWFPGQEEEDLTPEQAAQLTKVVADLAEVKKAVYLGQPSGPPMQLDDFVRNEVKRLDQKLERIIAKIGA